MKSYGVIDYDIGLTEGEEEDSENAITQPPPRFEVVIHHYFFFCYSLLCFVFYKEMIHEMCSQLLSVWFVISLRVSLVMKPLGKLKLHPLEGQ